MLSNKISIDEIPGEIENKRVVMRVDFNVPLSSNGKVGDRTRIVETLPTIRYILEHKCRCLVLVSHLGRPDGVHVKKYSLQPVSDTLRELLPAVPIHFAVDGVCSSTLDLINKSENGSIILLENVRFHLEEEGKGKDSNGETVVADEKKVAEFRAILSSFGDLFVNDAFGTSHRAHSSVVGINLPIKAAGLLVKKELTYFSKVLESPERPVLAILGGAKVGDKIKLINNLLDKVDMLIIGGGMAFTFKRVSGMRIGSSLFDEESSKLVEGILSKAKQQNVEISLPSDFVCADKFSADSTVKSFSESDGGIPDGWIGMDCGPQTILSARKLIAKAKTIVWNGPQGVCEIQQFSVGTEKFLDAVCEVAAAGTTTIIGGGDSAAFIQQAGKANCVSLVSTGGGASLELLEGKKLPGIVALTDRNL